MGRLDLRSMVSSAAGLAIVLASLSWMFAAIASGTAAPGRLTAVPGYLTWMFGQGFFNGILFAFFCVAFLLLVSLRMLLDAAPIRGCPNCQQLSLTRRAISPFGYRFYECRECGIRAKRKPFEDWEDASSARDDRKFRKRFRKSLAISVDPTGSHYEGTLIGMHGSLLEQKRLRHGPDDQRLISDEPTPREP